jgi:hypothetical protein
MRPLCDGDKFGSLCRGAADVVLHFAVLRNAANLPLFPDYPQAKRVKITLVGQRLFILSPPAAFQMAREDFIKPSAKCVSAFVVLGLQEVVWVN